jgi:hypothetical protein
MGTVEMALLIKYGIPLAIKLLSAGKDVKETKEVVNTVVSGMNDYKGPLLAADEAQTQEVVNGLFGVITGVTDALDGLIKGLGGIFK